MQQRRVIARALLHRQGEQAEAREMAKSDKRSPSFRISRPLQRAFRVAASVIGGARFIDPFSS